MNGGADRIHTTGAACPVSGATTRPPHGSRNALTSLPIDDENGVAWSERGQCCPGNRMVPTPRVGLEPTPPLGTLSDADGHARPNRDVTRSGPAIAAHVSGHARTLADTAGKA